MLRDFSWKWHDKRYENIEINSINLILPDINKTCKLGWFLLEFFVEENLSEFSEIKCLI